MRTLLLACFVASPLFAQSLDTQYETVGGFEGVFDKTSLSLSSLFDLEKDRSMIKLRDASGFSTISISARTISNDGKPTSPSVSFTIGPISGDGVRSDIFFSDSSGYYVTDNDIGGRASLSEYQQDDASVSFSVEATLQPVKRGDDGFEIDDARTSQVISGTFTGAMTDVD